MHIAIIGTGYVGLTAAVCFASKGHNVICVDKDPHKIQALCNKIPTIHEDGLPELLASAGSNLVFTTDMQTAIRQCQAIILAVGTPQQQNSGEADLQYIFSASKEAAKYIDEYKVFITKSTVPVGTNQQIKQIIEDIAGKKIDIVSNPEFMREGLAINDFLHPDRIVIGLESDKAKQILTAIYQPWSNYPILFTDIKTAELIKYVANAFLMTKVAFINQIETLSRKLNCNIADVATGIGSDHRIGSAFLKPGPGIGGSCFPKDSLALQHIGKQAGVDLSILQQVIVANNNRFSEMADLIKNSFAEHKKIAILGLAFKAGTDDARMSPAIEIIKKLLAFGFEINAFDPQAMPQTQEILADKIFYCKSLEECYRSSNCLAILTEWPEFKQIINFNGFASKKIIDLRRIL